MKLGGVVKATGLMLLALFALGSGAAHAQEPPTQPPVTQPPPTPATQAPTAPAAIDTAAAPVARLLSESDVRRRRNAIYIMEGMLVNSVRLAASQTQTEIEEAQPDLKVTLFAPVPPEAHGSYLEDYGVFFQVLIPSYQPSVVSILGMLPPNPAQPAAAARAVPLNPDAVYVAAVKNVLTDAMLDYSKALELGPTEWLTVAARGADGGPGPASEPSVMILRIKGRDLIEFLSGRLTRDEVRQRVDVRGFSGRR